MQRTLPSGRVHQQQRAGPARRAVPFTTARPLSSVACNAAPAANGNGVHANGNAASHGKCPTPAQTVRTLIDIVNEGTLCTVGPNGLPVGLPVTFSMDKSGKLQLQMDAAAVEMSNLKSGVNSCSLMVQAATQPARAVGAVSLMGKVEASADGSLPLSIDSCLYFGGLDQVGGALRCYESLRFFYVEAAAAVHGMGLAPGGTHPERMCESLDPGSGKLCLAPGLRVLAPMWL